jgi:hypothetical protein
MRRPSMRRILLVTVVGAAVGLVMGSTGRAAAQPGISPAGKKLAAVLDGMDVRQRWLPGMRINHFTGEVRGPAQNPNVTHCSSFVAAACNKLGVYILHPARDQDPGWFMLANAQAAWLDDQGKKRGWNRVADMYRAQQLANDGKVVVATYPEPGGVRHGHIAIVRPSTKDRARITADGPQVIHVGTFNRNSTDARSAFAHHPGAFPNGIRYHVHD